MKLDEICLFLEVYFILTVLILTIFIKFQVKFLNFVTTTHVDNTQ